MNSDIIELFCACLWSETNSFSNIPTELRNFKSCCFAKQLNHNSTSFFEAPIKEFIRGAHYLNWQTTISRLAAAMPAGPITKSVYESLRDEILQDLRQLKRADVILLHLHGAMIAEEYDDCEGDLLKNIRKYVGKSAFIGCLLDPHSHLTSDMLEHADVLVWMKEYPHTDYKERSQELFSIATKTLQRQLKPKMSMYDCGMIGIYPTTTEPMAGLIRAIRKMEQEYDDVLSISIVHGFPWGDVPDQGSKVVAVTDNNPDLGQKLAAYIGKQLIDIKDYSIPQALSIEQAIKRAEQLPKPVVLADYADNVGGGAAGDSTFILKYLLDNGISNVAFSSIWDPQVVEIAKNSGEGATIEITLGGKTGEQSGSPIETKARVKKQVSEVTLNFAGGYFTLGETALLDIGGIIVIVNSKRCQTYTIEAFTKLDINPRLFNIVVVKSSTHYIDSFQKISSNLITVTTPGTLNLDLKTIPFTKK